MDRLGDRAEDAVIRLAAVSSLALALLVGAFLRIDALGEPSLWLDEVLGEIVTDNALSLPWWRWLSGFHRDHGPLYYATQFASRIAGRDEAAVRLPAVLFGLLTIPLIWLAARLASRRSAVGAAACALLLATSPLHVYYSREGRPYALLMMLAAVLIVALLRGSRSIVAIVVVALLYTSVAATPVIAAAALAAVLAALVSRDRRDWLLAVPAAAAAMCVPFLYRGAERAAETNQFPDLDLGLLLTLLRAWTVSALGAELGERTATAMLLFAIAGAIALARSNRRACAVIVSMTVLPASFALAALWLSGHFFASRYVASSLLGFLILVGTGIAASASFATRWTLGRWPAPARILGAAVAIAIVIVTIPANWRTARREPFQKLDWRSIASTLRARARPGDVIATAQAYSYLSLRYYLRDLPPSVHFVLLEIIPAAEKWTASASTVWLVHAGYSTEISHWMCRYPVLLASPLEGFRLHYAPSARAFLLDRSSPAERRAVSSALGARGFTSQMGSGDDFLFGSGWASAEGAGREAFRWTIGRRALTSFPREGRRDRTIRFRAYPLTHESLSEQSLRIALNGVLVASMTLAPEWRDYAVSAPAAMWQDGMNELRFDFARATRPADVDERSTDQRELAAAFDWIAVDDLDAPPSDSTGELPSVPAIRLGADSFLDARTAWRSTPTRLPAARLRHDAVERLLARLGFDPRATWPQIETGQVRLDDVAETIAYGSCEDASTFVRRAFAILIGRLPTPEEEKSLVELERVNAISRIVKSPEFRSRVLQ